MYLVPLLVIQKKIQSANHLRFLVEKNILERARGHKLELIVEEGGLLVDGLDLCDEVELALVDFVFHEFLREVREK